VLDAEQKASALAYVVLAADGTPHVHHQLYFAPVSDEESGEGDNDGDKGDDDDGDEMQDSSIVGDARPAMSQRLREMLAMMKTELLAVHVASDPAFALDLGTFIMADRESRLGSFDMPSDLRASAPSRLLPDSSPTSSRQRLPPVNGRNSMRRSIAAGSNTRPFRIAMTPSARSPMKRARPGWDGRSRARFTRFLQDDARQASSIIWGARWVSMSRPGGGRQLLPISTN